jgi:peptide/nickel transport system permease protein
METAGVETARSRTRLAQAGAWVKTSPQGAICAGFLVAVVLVGVFAPFLAPSNPLAADLLHPLAGPSRSHLLGTDAVGRDILSRLIYGARPSLLGVAESVLVAFVLGVPLGLLAGYAKGKTDAIVTRLVDVLLAIPVIIILLTTVALFHQSLNAAMIVLGFLLAPVLIRITRAATLSVSEEPYVTAARVAGLRGAQVLRRHIFPRIVGPVAVATALLAGTALILETALNFLGLGVHPPNPTWGSMISDASQVIDRQSWMLWPTGGMVGLVVLALVLLGDAIRDSSTAAWQGGAVAPRRRPRQVARHLREDIRAELADALLSVRNITVSFPSKIELTVVDGVDLDLLPGETLGVVGESGSGKTITALAVLGALPPNANVTRGRWMYDGRDLTRLSAGALRSIRGRALAYIPQEPQGSLDPSFPVGAQVAEAVRTHLGGSRAAARRRAVELLDSVNIIDPEAVARKYPHQISGGMAQRVAIARALAGEPRILVADEPTTALDVTVQAEILDLLRKTQDERGLSILLVTHDWGVVADICDRTLVMYAGQVVESGDLEQIIYRPAHPYTRRLIASNPQLARRGEALPVIEGTVPSPEEWEPIGCRFYDRCDVHLPACLEAAIPMGQIAGSHLSRCIRRTDLESVA